MYESDVSDEQWKENKGYFKRSDPRGARWKHEKRMIFNAIMYRVKTGCQWRMLPREFPPWKTVYGGIV